MTQLPFCPSQLQCIIILLLLFSQAYASDAISQIVQRCSEESANTSKLELSYKREYDERRKLFNLVRVKKSKIKFLSHFCSPLFDMLSVFFSDFTLSRTCVCLPILPLPLPLLLILHSLLYPTSQVQELRGNIRVFCRARPPSARELERGADSDGAVCVDFPDSGVIKVWGVGDRGV